MPSESVVTAANICQSAVPVISLPAYVPQWAKLWRTKSSASISVRSWRTWTLSSAFGFFYAVAQLLFNGRGWALVFSTFSGVSFVVLTLVLVIGYRAGRREAGGP